VAKHCQILCNNAPDLDCALSRPGEIQDIRETSGSAYQRDKRLGYSDSACLLHTSPT
jgi:hypothetical protein